MTTPFVYLASESPRRRELLTQIGVEHALVRLGHPDGAGGIDESPRPGEAPAAYVRRIARAKAAAGWEQVCRKQGVGHPLLAADTTVTLAGRILGKPASVAEAAAMLRTLSGRTHEVLTAVAVAWSGRIEVALSESAVTMRALTEAEVAGYAGSGEPMDKAGAYAVQGRAAIFIERIEGSYSGVMGLPLFETANLLSEAGLVLL
jgi:septum formation protein